ncbi:hypothetical protein KRE40_09115 [Elizabethkingia meningoseptica]|uniref:50S ribosomal protein L27 n=1 Tax=Elizabethkingia meningoseptica TaxID=238 RepID=A0A1V3TWR1_ELIME|nr:MULTISPECIES: hypothetical protein [Elizabethkingia]AQX04587.1 hypothetical protein BBD33_04685 [Elizabethkingia meningoseptica]AQX12050.1 hypothetical protein BBD35_06515 [Elizabethkingia meningoseptica]AQX46631.1 hypothetical protein B5G46_04680 [Elizabethkingia meningoseptica]EJK5328467.1 hypothetical protein [Elizabethkingia meningoseptica]EOR31404.1 hypothetical protein L100_00170 [Elizabethkingia meningoseptica ATCC 13253 = NBRC 12535]
MHNIFLQAHRGFAYLELLLVALFIIALLTVMLGYSGKVSKLLRKSTLFVMIFFHIQFLIGIIMLLGTSGFMDTIKSMGMGGLMKNSALRFTYIEHPFSMLIAAVLMTILNKKLKVNDKISMGMVIIAVLAIALFAFALPWAKLMGA